MPKVEKIKVNVKDRVEDNCIDLSLSELTDVPVREIASFKRVTILDLSNNKLVSLGKNFPTLSNLTRLDLSRNQIKFLPEDFGNLRNLRHLDLYNNKLEHLPLSFGNLTNLRYLDLKGNPLTPALAKIVGLCLTAKECNISAKNTIKCMARMQEEVEKAKEKLELENNALAEAAEDATKNQEAQKSKKTKKPKNKSKKTKGENASPKPNTDIKLAKTKVEGSSGSSSGVQRKSSTALRTIFTFILLLAINILIIYIIMFKNPEIAEKLVEFIPHQYRDWILTKSEYFRLRVSDFIQNIRTPPQHN